MTTDTQTEIKQARDAQHVSSQHHPQQPLKSNFALPVPELGAWRQGNTGVEGVWAFDSEQPGPQVLITALIHGNEISGAWALLTLLERGLRPKRGRLTLAFCNLAAFDRFDPQTPDATRYVEEDMNRVWGGVMQGAAPQAAQASLERQRAAALWPWFERADYLLDLHSMHEDGAPLVLTGTLPRNLQFARRLGLHAHIVVDAGHAEGVRLRDAGPFGTVAGSACALLVESGYHGDLSSRALALDCTLRFLDACGNVDTSALAEDVAACRAQLPTLPVPLQVEVTHAVAARSMDFRFAEPWTNLHVVPKAGTLLALDQGQPIRTPYDDCVLVMPSLKQLHIGGTVMRLARQLQSMS